MLVALVGKAIKMQRRSLGITQPHLAELAGISTNSLSGLERGKGNPSLDTLEKLATVLGMELKLEVKMPTGNS